MGDLSDAHDRAVECGRNDSINLVSITATPYKKADYGLGVAWEHRWRTHHQAFQYRRKRAGKYICPECVTEYSSVWLANSCDLSVSPRLQDRWKTKMQIVTPSAPCTSSESQNWRGYPAAHAVKDGESRTLCEQGCAGWMWQKWNGEDSLHLVSCIYCLRLLTQPSLGVSLGISPSFG